MTVYHEPRSPLCPSGTECRPASVIDYDCTGDAALQSDWNRIGDLYDTTTGAERAETGPPIAEGEHRHGIAIVPRVGSP